MSSEKFFKIVWSGRLGYANVTFRNDIAPFTCDNNIIINNSNSNSRNNNKQVAVHTLPRSASTDGLLLKSRR